MGKGQKNCGKCGFATGPRAFKCPNCEEPFLIKGCISESKKVKIQKEIANNGDDAVPDFDWKTLQKGDRIKVYKSLGPYWVSSNEINEEDGSPLTVNLCDNGIYIVDRVDNQGIHCYNVKDRSCGHYFIYMGPIQPSPIDNRFIRHPHKIRKLRRKIDKYGNHVTVV